jgi:ketosteroid isomerase-like protein
MVDANAHPNLRLLERGMAAFVAHDLATLEEIFDPDLLWHQCGESCLSGDSHGVDEVFVFFARRAAMTADTYRIDIHGAIASDHFVTVLSTASANIEGRYFAYGLCSVYRLEGHRVVEAWHHPADPKAEADFYGR